MNDGSARTESAVRGGAVDGWAAPPRGRTIARLLGVGAVGVAALYPTLGPMTARLAADPAAPDVSGPVLRLLLLINPTIMLAAGVVAGALLAPRLGVRSHLAEADGMRDLGRRLQPEVPRAVVVGALTAVLVLVLDLAFRPIAGAEIAALAVERPRTIGYTVAAMLYGGLTEELIMRWGVVSLIAWGGWRVLQRGRGRPRSGIVWSAIIAGAILFGAAHLGAVAAGTALTPALVVRTVLLNAVAGVVYGRLFWSRSLETAMVAHGFGHIIFTAAAWIGLA